MKGQLWQQCRCGQEPVCCSCEKCAKHCKCGSGKPEFKIDPIASDPYRRGMGQGFGSTDDGEESK